MTSKKVDNSYHRFVRLYTYHLVDNGAIGKTYEGEDVIDYTYEISGNMQQDKIGSNNTNWSLFYLYSKNTRNSYVSLDVLKIISTPSNYDVTYTSGASTYGAYSNSKSVMEITQDNNFCIVTNRNNATNDYTVNLFKINNDVAPYACNYQSFKNIAIVNNVYVMINQKSDSSKRIVVNLYDIIEDNAQDSGFKLNLTKTLYIKNENISTSTYVLPGRYVTRDNKNIILTLKKGTSLYFAVVNIDNLLSADNEAEIDFKQFTLVGTVYIPFNAYQLIGNLDGTKIQMLTDGTVKTGTTSDIFLYTATNVLDTNKIIGVKYKGEYFAKQEAMEVSE